MTVGEGAPQYDRGRKVLLRMRTEEGVSSVWQWGRGLLRMTTGEGSPQDWGGFGMTLIYCHSEPSNVIPNEVRNLRSSFDGWFITATVLQVRRHLRFFGVRASE